MNWQLRADSNWSSSRARQWVVACIVSKRSVRVTTESEDTMTQLRGAYLMFEFIRHYYPAKARELRKRYGYSRFYDLYKEWRRFELAPDICIEHLESDLSNAGMVMQVQDIHDPREEWERRAGGWYKSFDKFAHVAYGAPEWFTDWVRDSRDLFRENGIK